MAVSFGHILLAALALGSAATAAPAAKVPKDLVAAIMRDTQVAACANEANTPAQTYIAQAFELHNVTLHSGERMTVAVAIDACMFLGQSSRIMIFERTTAGYRRVLDDVTLPNFVQVSEDGTVVLPTHDTMETIFEATYVWNGTVYVFSAPRSHIYDVPLNQRRPYEVPVRFPRGAFATTVSGNVALNFGQQYVIQARAGQRMTIELTKHTGRRPTIILSYGQRNLVELDTDRWSGELPQTGAYHLIVLGSGETDATLVSTYAIRLVIH
jgi:hypothetical protein